jgi:catechol 2,3-dioxygenase-like lactoylglutathione lyase family enzyme
VPTSDLAASIRFYRDGLGLELTEEWDDMGRGAILRASSDAEVELIEVGELADPPEPRTTLGLQVSEDEVDAVYGRLEAAGARLKAPPRVRSWGMRGFGAFDPSGVPVNIYAPVRDAARAAREEPPASG